MGTDAQQSQVADAIKHVFVLMLENRSFDHMLGFAGLSGPDAMTVQPTRALDLSTIRSLMSIRPISGTRCLPQRRQS